MELKIVEGSYSVIKFPTAYRLPAAFQQLAGFKSLTYTEEECSVVVPSGSLATTEAIAVDDHWAIIQIVGELDFSLVGILTQLANPLATAGISIFALSTYNTDYLLIKADVIEQAITVLAAEGHTFM